MNQNQLNKINKKLTLIISLGALLRFVFYKWVGAIYYGTPNFYEQGDSSGWIRSIYYLIHTGTYTFEPEVPNGEFFRPPGYSFFMLPLYLLSGGDTQRTYALLAIVQPILDVVAIWFVYKIAIRFFAKENYALFTAFVYACFPFIIVWTPVALAESTSIFFMLGGFYFLMNTQIKWNYVWSGLFIAALVLTRIQSIFILFAFTVGFFYALRKQIIPLKNVITFFVSFFCLYGLWPIRNYVFHNRIEFLMDYHIGRNWSPDYLSFMRYIYSIQTDHQPEYSQIIFNKKVTWPPASYKYEGDSVLLDSVVKLSRTCGTGFSKFMFHEKVRSSWIQDGHNCDSTIAGIFNTLADKQYSQNAFHAWVTIPFGNLKKTFFKNELYGNKSRLIMIASSLLFSYRTLLLLLGIAGVILGLRKKDVSKFYLLIAITFMTTWYLYICFLYRNIEIRYLLQSDVLMLLPATYVLYLLGDKFFGKKSIANES